MTRPLAVILLLAAAAGSVPAKAEDAAHRADRLRTEQLNRAAAAKVDRRIQTNVAAQARFRDARADYAREMRAWRRQVAACEAGDRSACTAR
jgi:hypothetical protein